MSLFPWLRSAALLCLLLALAACEQRHHAVTRGFYYWKTIYKPTPYEQQQLKKLRVQKMYVRLFDVDYEPLSGQSIPIAPVQLPAAMDTGMQYVPVVFITQRTLAHLDTKGIPSLAKKINDLVAAICNTAAMKAGEVQIDCDWTAANKSLYFALLSALKGQSFIKGKTLSCTIRMHQVKYTTSSGIPPVDKGMLMCYSMGDMKKTGVRNSILDADEAEEYLKHIDTYDLPLDIALPLFQWCIQFRQGKFVGILHDLTPDEVGASKLFIHTGENMYTCRADTLWQGYRLRAKDELRAESASFESIKKVAAYTSRRIARPDVNVLLFSCDSVTLSKYSVHELEAVYTTYR